MNLKKIFGPRRTAPTPTFVLSEGTARTWLYHIRRDDAVEALCGKPTLAKPTPLRLWGFVGHLNERYCPDCEVKAIEQGILPGGA